MRALSTLLSTAALDKNPQSRERGITLDLGFSALVIPAPEKIAEYCDHVQYTLVDCPGHASLIKTIIGGAQIIDRMILIVDINKGIQTQTAECLVIGEILADDILIVLNKIDLVPQGVRDAKIQAVSKMIKQTLSNTRFNQATILPVSASVGGGENATTFGSQEKSPTLGLEELIKYIADTTLLPDRSDTGPFLYSVDHGFPIKGQGTVITGTVLRGSIDVGMTVELPELGLERKIKSMQMFKKSVQHAGKGDRVAMCLTNIDAKLIERTLVATPHTVPKTWAVLALVRKVKYFQRECLSKSKIHITIGHSTVMSSVTFFGANQLKDLAANCLGNSLPDVVFDASLEFEYDDGLRGGGKALGGPFLQWALIQFEHPVYCQAFSTIIGSRLDTDVDTKSCRIAFYGKASRLYKAGGEDHSDLRVFKMKSREGSVDRIADKQVSDDGTVNGVIGKDMFSKESLLDRFLNLSITTDTDAVGKLESTFGKTGKFNVHFQRGAKITKGDKLYLRYKKYVFGSSSKKQLEQ